MNEGTKITKSTRCIKVVDKHLPYSLRVISIQQVDMVGNTPHLYQGFEKPGKPEEQLLKRER